MTSLLQSALDAGRASLLAVGGRTVTFPGRGRASVQALINEALEDRDRRRFPDLNMRNGAVIEIGTGCLGFVPSAGEYITDDKGRRLRVAEVTRRVNIYQLACEFVE